MLALSCSSDSIVHTNPCNFVLVLTRLEPRQNYKDLYGVSRTQRWVGDGRGGTSEKKTDWEVGMTFFNIDIFCINNILEIVVHP